jgi:predicted phosphodiesterase
MKLAVISDIHGNLLALEAVLADIARQGVDHTVNLGDILSGPLQPAETADLLMAQDFTTIRGNHERQLLALLEPGAPALDPLSSDGFAAGKINAAQAAWLRALPASLVIEPDIRLCHGTPDTDLHYWLETVVPGWGDGGATGTRPATPEEVHERLGDEPRSLVLCGHTHVPRVVQCGSTLVVNPGSVGLQAYSDAHPYPHVVENGAPHARYALLEQAPGGWQVELRAIPYAHETQAEVARRHGRPDWAQALLTGRIPRQ